MKRTINNVTKRYVEFFEDRFPDDADQRDAFFVDSGLTYGPSSGAATATITGLSHLEGQNVSVFADGAVRSSTTVSSGQITLVSAASLVHVGLPYTSSLTTLRLMAGDPQGPSQGKLKRIDHVLIRLYRALGVEVFEGEPPLAHSGGGEHQWDDVPFDSSVTPLPLFTGDKVVPLDNAWGLEGRVALRVRTPVPASVLALGFRVDSSQRGSE